MSGSERTGRTRQVGERAGAAKKRQRCEQRGVVWGPVRCLDPRCEVLRQRERKDGGRGTEQSGRWRQQPDAELIKWEPWTWKGRAWPAGFQRFDSSVLSRKRRVHFQHFSLSIQVRF